MKRTLLAVSCSLLAGSLALAESNLALDRGLPAANLNNDAGAESRSNVRWTLYDDGFVGDDLRVGQPGEKWVIDAIRVWTVPGGRNLGDPNFLSDFYQDVRLYFGSAEGGVSPVSVGRLEANSNRTSNADIAIVEATGDAAAYDDFGARVRVWQIDFNNLKLTVNGGEAYLFGAHGLGRARTDGSGKTYAWFNHASNRALGDASATGSDDQLHLFRASGANEGAFLSDGKGWNKNSDINVQVFARRVE